MLTEILDVLIGEIAQETTRLLCASLLPGPPCLVNHNAICTGGRNEGEAVTELSPAPVIVEAYPGEEVPENGEKKEKMSAR